MMNGSNGLHGLFAYCLDLKAPRFVSGYSPLGSRLEGRLLTVSPNR